MLQLLKGRGLGFPLQSVFIKIPFFQIHRENKQKMGNGRFFCTVLPFADFTIFAHQAKENNYFL